MAKHYIREPIASAILGDAAAVTSYETGLSNDRIFGGQPYSRVSCIAPYLDGERVVIVLPGTVQGLTPEMVQEATRRLTFLRVKFVGLSLEIKGDSYNTVSFVGTAERAALVQPGQK